MTTRNCSKNCMSFDGIGQTDISVYGHRTAAPLLHQRKVKKSLWAPNPALSARSHCCRRSTIAGVWHRPATCPDFTEVSSKVTRNLMESLYVTSKRSN